MRLISALPSASKPLALALIALALFLVGCAPQNQPGSGQGGTDVPSGGDPDPPGFTPPNSVTDRGDAIRDLYIPILLIAAAIFILVEVILFWSLLRHRRRRGDDSLPSQTHGNNFLEFIWTAVPTVIVLGLFWASITTLQVVDARTPTPNVKVDVIGFQWQWTFEYPAYETAPGKPLAFTGVGSKGPEMVVPVNETVHLRLIGNDVNHAFYVPQFLFKRDVIPGHDNEMEFKIDTPGTYVGQCAEFCGLMHAQMLFTVRAVPRPEFDAWVNEQVAKARATATPAPPPSPGVSPGESPGQGATLEVSASNSTAFDQSGISGPANTPLTIVFKNDDPSAPHNVAIKNVGPSGDFVGMPLANAGEQVTYGPTPPIEPGQYEFFCSVHPNMRGTLTVK